MVRMFFFSTREREREFNLTFESLYGEDRLNELWPNEQSERYKNKWQVYICENPDTKIEPIDLFYPLTKECMSSGGALHHSYINGNETFKRILIRKRVK